MATLSLDAGGYDASGPSLLGIGPCRTHTSRSVREGTGALRVGSAPYLPDKGNPVQLVVLTGGVWPVGMDGSKRSIQG